MRDKVTDAKAEFLRTPLTSKERAELKHFMATELAIRMELDELATEVETTTDLERLGQIARCTKLQVAALELKASATRKLGQLMGEMRAAARRRGR
jgi:hypothetical protein